MKREFPKPKTKVKWDIGNIVKLLHNFQDLKDGYDNQDAALCANWLIENKIDKKVGVTYLLKILNQSKYNTYRLAMSDFNRVIENYLAGDYSKEDLETFSENLEPVYGDNAHVNFTAIRVRMINYLLKGDSDNFIEAAGLIFGFDDSDGSEQVFKQAKIFIADLAELAYGQEASALKILMGDKNEQRTV